MNQLITTLPTIEHILSSVDASIFNEVGSNRAATDYKQIDANDDYTAVLTWLNEYSDTPSTYRVYQKEAERLLLWCIFKQNKSLSSLNRNDFEGYIAFMKNPQPRELWCGKQGGRGYKKGSKNWKPFSSPLSATSLKTAITIINSLMTYLVGAGYLQASPLRLLKKAKRQPHLEERKIEIQARILEPDEWQAMLDTLNNMPEETPHQKDDKYRLRFIVAMLFFLGLRIGELTTHHWNAFRQINGNWWFVVRGKGNKLAKIPVNNTLLTIVIEFRQHLRMSPLPEANDETPLVPSWRSSNGLTARAINQLLKELAITTGEKHFKNNPQKQAKLKRFSAHWLRHLSATMQDRVGIPFSHIRSNLRHENDETTRIYVHGDDNARVNSMNIFLW